jgi:energy-coupling factor transporter ATP-binding protein EcfA2
MSRGELVLFTGAGFSADAFGLNGEKLPVGRKLREHIWSFAFPGEPFDEEATLSDIYAVAMTRAQKRLGEDLGQRLRVDPNQVPEFYRTWFSIPWMRIYTLNVDDLDDVVASRFTLPTAIRSVSAVTDETVPSGSFALSIHLNGKIIDFPRATFSAQQFGERTAVPDIWYRQLAAELAAYPVVFVGTVLEEPPLWQQIATRRLQARRSKELRPRSYLVTPSLGIAKRAILKELNVEWVPLTARQFAEEVLDGLHQEAEAGRRTLSEMRGIRPARAALRPVSTLAAETKPDLAEFLMGREPHWADVTSGYAIEREFERALAERVMSESPSLVVITGTAASGKSTTLKRLAVALQASGQDVQWLDIETDLALGRLREVVRGARPDVLAIDDVDAFGTSAGPLLSQFLHEVPGLTVLVAVRSSRAERLSLDLHLKDYKQIDLLIPPLTDDDIDALIDALTRANRLGLLRGKPLEEQRLAFRRRAQRQLLVAMIEATLDVRFEDKVHSECSDLSEPERLAYAILSVATRYRQFLRREEILVAMGGQREDALAAVDSLVRKHLVVVEEGRQFTVRHRVIAEEALKYFHRSGYFAEAVEGILFALATKLSPERSTRTREHRLLVRLLNHKFMLEEVQDVGRAREIYETLEDVLKWDYHYWLQRGSMEVEASNVRGAENFLGQARGLAPDDYKVQTEWAYMLLKRAAQEAEGGLPGARDLAEEAFIELHDAIARRGVTDSYPYHVLGSQGLSWTRRAPLTATERTEKLRELLDTVREGREYHPRQRDLEILERDIYDEYLRSAMP